VGAEEDGEAGGILTLRRRGVSEIGWPRLEQADMPDAQPKKPWTFGLRFWTTWAAADEFLDDSPQRLGRK